MQGLISGINAARHSSGESVMILARETSFIGTLIDDLVTKDLREPYRMFTRFHHISIFMDVDSVYFLPFLNFFSRKGSI